MVTTLDSTKIFVFKTNVETESDRYKIATVLNTHNSIEEWSVDIDDIDCVLRIITDQEIEKEIIAKINELGFLCAELE